MRVNFAQSEFQKNPITGTLALSPFVQRAGDEISRALQQKLFASIYFFNTPFHGCRVWGTMLLSLVLCFATAFTQIGCLFEKSQNQHKIVTQSKNAEGAVSNVSQAWYFMRQIYFNLWFWCSSSIRSAFIIYAHTFKWKCILLLFVYLNTLCIVLWALILELSVVCVP